jgi:hypothetical protein
MTGRAQLQANHMRNGTRGKTVELALDPNTSAERASDNKTVENATRSPLRVAPPRVPSDQSSDGSFWTPPPATFDDGYTWSSQMIQSPTNRDTKGSSLISSSHLVCDAPRLPLLPNDTDKESHPMRTRAFHLPPRFSPNLPSVLRPLSPAPLQFPTGPPVRPQPRTVTLETVPHDLAPTPHHCEHRPDRSGWKMEVVVPEGQVRDGCPK